MKNPFRTLAILYAALVVVVAVWALCVDIALLHSQREHLLPDVTLFFVSFPASLSVSLAYEAWPQFFSKPFTQLAWVAFCGLSQAAVLFLASRRVRSVRAEA